MISRRLLFRHFAVAAVLMVCFGCASRKTPIKTSMPPTPASGQFLDLQAGWRIRQVTPVLKSGKFVIDSRTAKQAGNAVAIKSRGEFIGYQVAYYSVKARPKGGVSIRFASARFKEKGKSRKQSEPRVRLFDLPPNMRFVRLVFLTRVSERDHDQGILAAPSIEELEVLTRSVRADPEKNCKEYADAICEWVPVGIAVQPQKIDPKHRGKWIPVL